ncbi:23S rRNA pseudouridine(2604) synthase RluF [Faecalibacter macacae]|uniref:Pseudouridine synthase n=1 Tax=Faecalibacter macacae TaxID=1859289 RepID=A0A3L9MET4_9FLAO|nr:23S rRNA pseudouridine(2604) synthase RluF [Faecalibacter macacae]RLZ10516.1 23S rRNA pseudouridine(2604) synthase RluF [Faecalibacter macacae]
MDEKNMIRLNKYISDSGYCSRREADQYIENRLVHINGRVAKPGQHAKPGDVVTVKGVEIEPRDKAHAAYIMLNKPVGVTCTTDSSDPDNIVDFLSFGERIFPIGRLDKDSQGLILLTSDGDIVNKILRAGNNHEKEYVVTVNKPITDEFCERMSKGVPILNQVTKKCKIEKVSTNVFKITLIQGLNRQIRRMCEYFGYTVKKLERVRIMNLTLNVPVGQFRDLTSEELAELNRLTADSEKHEEKKSSNKPKKSPAKKSPDFSPDFKDDKGKSIQKKKTNKPKSTTQARIGKSKAPTTSKGGKFGKRR